MARLIWTEPALQDLEEIAEYIELDKPLAAKRLVKNIFNRVDRLEAHPLSGRRPPELGGTSYREVIVGPCRIFYRVEKNNAVYILYVLRGERQLSKYLLEARGEESGS